MIRNPDGEVKIETDEDITNAVALVDADDQADDIRPRNILLINDIRVILASSPRGLKDRKWLKQLNVPEQLRVRMMDIWSEKELIITG
jgi:hypothetical protein